MPKKVVHVITGLGDGGAEGVLYRLCSDSKIAQHVVISLMDDGRYGVKLRENGVRVYCLGMKKRSFEIAKVFNLVKIIKSESPDLVQTWMYHADFIGGIAARFAGVKRVFWGVRHSNLEKSVTRRSTLLIARLCAILSSFLPEKVICCADKAASTHINMGYDKAKIVVIHNGVDLTRFYPNVEARNEIRSDIKVSSDTFLVGMVGRWDKQKDHASFLKALSEVRKNFENFKCVLVGTNISEENSDLVRLVSQTGLEGKVILCGQRNDVPSIMNALDLHVLSSFTEGFPNVVAESMACGTPCVSTNVGDAAFILGVEKLSWESSDSVMLSELITSIASKWAGEPMRWHDLKEYCRSRIKNNFSHQKMVDRFEEVWFGNS